MTKDTYTNENLAKDYFRVVAKYSEGFISFSQQRNAITNCPIDISSYYRSNGNLEELKIYGIGKKAKSILKLILNYGVDLAIKLLEEREKNASENMWKRVSGWRPDIDYDSDPLWDDIVKAYEDK